MKELNETLKNAYDTVSAPDALKERTITYIESQRTLENDSIASLEQNSSSPEKGTLAFEGIPSPQISGEALSVGRKRRSRSRVLGYALAACMACLLAGFGGFSLYTSETTYIGIDLNPSLELGINRFDRVVSTHAFNEEAQEILDGLSLEGMHYNDALDALAQDKLFSEYLTVDAFLSISVTSKNEEQSLAVQGHCEQYLTSLPCRGSCHSVSDEIRTEAHAEHMGVNRYQAALILLDLDSSLTLEDCKTMSMRELRERITAAGGEELLGSASEGHHGQGHSQGQGQGMGSGNGNGAGQGRWQ